MGHVARERQWWAGRDSNPRRQKPADLQSALVDRLSTDPWSRCAGLNRGHHLRLRSVFGTSADKLTMPARRNAELMEPRPGIEPGTSSLPWMRSTN